MNASYPPARPTLYEAGIDLYPMVKCSRCNGEMYKGDQFWWDIEPTVGYIKILHVRCITEAEHILFFLINPTGVIRWGGAGTHLEKQHMSATKLLACNCTHEYQTKKYGSGMRVHNQKRNGDWVCTVCASSKAGTGADKKQAEKEAK